MWYAGSLVGRAGNMEGRAKHAGAGGSMRKYAGVCGSMREVCCKYAGKYAGCRREYMSPCSPHTSPILSAYFRTLPETSRILPHTSAYSRQLLHASHTLPYFPRAPPRQAPAYSRIPHTCACYRVFVSRTCMPTNLPSQSRPSHLERFVC